MSQRQDETRMNGILILMSKSGALMAVLSTWEGNVEYFLKQNVMQTADNFVE